MNNFTIIIKKEAAQFFRDPMTLFIGILPLPIALVFRFGIPPLVELTAPWVDLSGLEPFWAGLLIILGPMLFGMTGGFLFLDEKDQGLLPSLKVTPVSDSFWILAKTFLPMAITIPGVLLQISLCGLVPPLSLRYLPLALLAAIEAPFLTLFLASFSKDKVQGMTMGKTISIVMIPPLLLFFIENPLVHLTALSPPYWILQTFRYAEEGDRRYWMFFLGGLVYHGILGLLFFRISQKKIFS